MDYILKPLIDIILVGIVGRYMLFGHIHIQKQMKHIATIMNTTELNPLVTDYYYKPATQLLTYGLCNQMYHIVSTKNRFIYQNPLYHDYSKRELQRLNDAYMEYVYLPQNFPLTYRNTTYVAMTNETANYIYKIICNNQINGINEPRIYSTSLSTTIMLFLFGLQIRGLLYF